VADSPVVQLRVPETVLALIDEARGEQSRSAWFLELAEAELDDSGPDQPAVGSPITGLPVTSDIAPGGVASPGVACSWPECWARDTRRYGATDPGELTRGGYRECPRDAEKCGLALCPAHAARLDGFRFVRPREVPRSAARAREPA
jgi:hypothetical protein